MTGSNAPMGAWLSWRSADAAIGRRSLGEGRPSATGRAQARVVAEAEPPGPDTVRV
jgi:hypothetical protein